MTIRQLQLISAIALMASIFVAIITRAGLRRIAGALAGAAAAGIAGLGIVAAAMRIGWWHFNIQRQPAVVLLFCLIVYFARTSSSSHGGLRDGLAPGGWRKRLRRYRYHRTFQGFLVYGGSSGVGLLFFRTRTDACDLGSLRHPADSWPVRDEAGGRVG